MALLAQAIDKADPLKNVQGYSSDDIQMGAEDSVEKRVGGIIKADSPLMTLARTGAKQTAQRRGLLNTSIAAGAGEEAVLRTATPIASQDASTAATYQLSNQAQRNRAQEFTAGQGNIARNLVETGLQTRETQAQAGDITSRQIAETGAIDTSLQAMRGEQSLEQIAGQGDVQSQLQAERGEIDKQLQEADAATREQLLNRQGEIDQELSALQSEQRQQEMFSGFTYDQILQELKGQQAIELTGIETRNSQLMQASQSASLFFSNQAAAIGDILANADIPKDQKSGLIDHQIRLLENGMAVFGTISDVDLTEILQWDYAEGTAPNFPGTEEGDVLPGGTGEVGDTEGTTAAGTGSPIDQVMDQMAGDLAGTQPDFSTPEAVTFVNNTLDWMASQKMNAQEAFQSFSRYATGATWEDFVAGLEFRGFGVDANGSITGG